VKPSNFVEFGYGEDVDFSKAWHRTVLEDHAMWGEFGHPPFDIRQLPSPMYQAHQAILRGKAKRQQDERED